MAQEIAARAFDASGLPSGRVPVMFTTDWCGYCRRFAPHFARLPGAHVVDISDDDDPLWDDLRIRVVPTVLLFEGGAIVGRWEGALNASHAEEIVAALQGEG